MKEKIINFFTDVYKEMGKVTWPTQKELQESTLVVLGVCGVIAAFVFVVDWIVSNAIKGIF
ncbi:MAG: preprotein translocase subunit SecE [Bacteroidetes bacterium]|jgi:preprotein translocase subunit SecE|nr:preprotein translocase subunit SecE [Bacteroidota bacterium]